MVAEHNGSGVALRNLNQDNLSLNPVLWCETLGMLFYSTFSSSHNSMNDYLAVDSGGYLYLCINCWMLAKNSPDGI